MQFLVFNVYKILTLVTAMKRHTLITSFACINFLLFLLNNTFFNVLTTNC